MLNQLDRVLWTGVRVGWHFLQVAFHNGMMMALHIDNVIVIIHTHAATSVFGPKEGEEHIICEDLCKTISPFLFVTISPELGEVVKNRRGTYTSEENTNDFPVLVSRGDFLATDFRR
jgi:hypothetical protein